MFRQLFIFIILLHASVIISQPRTSGKITFKETVKFKIDIEGGNPELAKMLPPSQSVEKALYFKGGESLYKYNEKPKDTEINHEEGSNKFQMVIKVPENVTYVNTDEQTLLQFQDLMGKEFLITDKPASQVWKVTGEQKKILDFICQKAILSDTSKVVIAWFTPQIPVSSGPSGMGSLPGMILGIEQDNGDRLTLATAIEDLPASFNFEKPAKGKKVSKIEFEKIREEKMKEMGIINGKGPGVKMIIREERH